MPSSCSISSGVLTRLSRYSKRNARPTPEESATEEAEEDGERPTRAHGMRRDLGGVDDADVAGPQLARDARLLRTLQQRLIDLRVAVDVALQSRRSRSPCGSSPALRPSVTRAPRSCSVPARRPPGIRCARPERPSRSRPVASTASLDRRLHLDHVGVRSPNFSASCTCLRCRLASSRLLLLDELVARMAGNVSSLAGLSCDLDAVGDTSLPSAAARSWPWSRRR